MSGYNFTLAAEKAAARAHEFLKARCLESAEQELRTALWYNRQAQLGTTMVWEGVG